MKLNELSDNPGARKARMRVGRGIGSGKGKTSARGQKGQKARNTVAVGFEGGQMPIYRRLPKRGFNNISRKEFAVLNLGRLQKAIDAKKVDVSKAITVDVLVKAGVVDRHFQDGVRLLGHGEITSKVNIEVTGATKSAITAVEKTGGTVKIA